MRHKEVSLDRDDEDDSEPSDNEPTIEELYTILTEPSEGDYVLSSGGSLGSTSIVSIYGTGFIGEFSDDDTAEATIARRMRREKFFPDVWTQSDHGNFECVSERFYSEHSGAIYGE